MSNQELPAYNALINKHDPKNYITTKALQDAVFVALSLSQPLLVTGEPGTGKTQLAHWIAYHYGLPEPLEFHAKTTSTASDMFYRYDALRRFQDSQLPNVEIDIQKYVSFEALGKAILLTRTKNKVRSIILIDEIDKAPRDLPNDVLMEIERMTFTVKETGKTYAADLNYRPIVVITSNSEKNLPDAFLRRCVYFHITFPDEEQLTKIIQCRFRDTDNNPLVSDDFIQAAVAHFLKIRKLNLKKKPATAECIAWMSIMKTLGIDPEKPDERMKSSYSVLAKNKEDLNMLIQRLNTK